MASKSFSVELPEWAWEQFDAFVSTTGYTKTRLIQSAILLIQSVPADVPMVFATLRQAVTFAADDLERALGDACDPYRCPSCVTNIARVAVTARKFRFV